MRSAAPNDDAKRSLAFSFCFDLPPVTSYAYISSPSALTWEGKKRARTEDSKKNKAMSLNKQKLNLDVLLHPPPSPSSTSLLLFQQLNPELSAYRDRRFEGTQQEFDERLRTSTTLYVGNLSFYTSEEQLLEAFSKAGDVLRIVMGLDKQQRTPCGFAFGE